MIKKLYLAIIAVCMFGTVQAQFYNNGAPPASLKWNQIRTDSLRIIYPREFDVNARRILYYMDTIRPLIGYGFRHGPMKTPVVINTENFYSNGLSILAPKRIEIVGLPGIATYPTPWLKQLSVHEYRHMVQYNNINRSTVKALSYVFGQQLSLVSTGLLPFWFIEGDATMAETQFAKYGRGIQPSFSMHYRAAAANGELTARRNPDKWFCGSYKDYVPSHYELGYQLVAHSERLYGKYIWDDVARYSSNFPFLLFTTQIALNKYYDTSTKKLYHETFGYLSDYWNNLPGREDSSTPVDKPERLYTTYEHPVWVDDNTLLVLKTDYDKVQRFVLIDLADGTEKHLCHTGGVSTRPSYRNGTVYWTEYRATLWEQRNNSVICYMRLADGRPHTIPGERAAMFPTPLGGDELAFVRYNYNGQYTIHNGTSASVTFPHDITIHGLAYDEVTDGLYFLMLDDEEGEMAIGLLGSDIKEETGEEIHFYSKILTADYTISDLRAGGGRLYFGSTRSGYDEAHVFELGLTDASHEGRITTSRYGSFSPCPSPDGSRIALTTYGRKGYKVSVQSSVPVDTNQHFSGQPNESGISVDPPLVKWALPGNFNIDDMKFTEKELDESRTENPSRRYRKALNLFNFHSWIPADIDIDNIISNFDFNDIRFGATLMSQNLLSTASTRLRYGYGNGRSVVNGNFKYDGLAPKFELDVTWSDSGQRIGFENIALPAPALGKSYLALSARVYLPLVFAAGYHTRTLTPNVQYIYRNNIVYNLDSNSYKTGQHLVAGSLSFSDNVRRARLDLIPRWGYTIRGSAITEPARNLYMTTVSAYGRVYTPGIVRHHGVSLAATYQRSFGQGYAPYGVMDILPIGCDNVFAKEYAAVSANYYLPIAYPDWGLSGVFFIKRIYARLRGDYAIMRDFNDSFGPVRPDSSGDIWSYGGSLMLDIGFLRLPAPGTCTATFGLYMPKGADRPFFTTSFSIPL